MAVIVFDLDDTLYNEIDYVKSGFRAVAQFAADEWRLNPQASYAFMVEMLDKYGRGKVFDEFLIRHTVYTKKNVRKCLSVYRRHQPEISLNEDAMRCMDRFEKYPKYIVTDGNKLVQLQKIRALGLESKVKFSYITYRYGLKHAKPSPYLFHKICEREKVSPQQVLYVGDNPNKDFVGIKPLGFKTIRILQGHYKHQRNAAEYEADVSIHSLDELDNQLLHAIFK